MDAEKERRAAPRYELKGDMEYRLADPGFVSAWTKGKTININTYSMLFSTEEPLLAGQNVEVRMRWPLNGPTDGTGELKLQGVVSWASEGRCALSVRRREVI